MSHPQEKTSFIYELDKDGQAVITGYTGSDENLVIPPRIEGHPVIRIDRDAFFRGKMTSVTLPQGLEIVGIYAFRCCERLKKAVLPQGLKCLWMGAFWNCSALEEINLPDSLTLIDRWAFQGCTSLKDVLLPPGARIDPDAFDHPGPRLRTKGGRPMVTEDPFYRVVYEVREDGAWVKGRNGGSKTLVEINARCMGAPVVGILPKAFQGDTGIEKVIIHGGVREIGCQAFQGCSNLYEIHIPDSVTSIGEEAIPRGRRQRVIDPDCAYARSQDRYLSRQYMLDGGTYEPEYITRCVGTVVASGKSYALEYCRENGCRCLVDGKEAVPGR